jgi:hypothetical protein
VRGRWSKRAGAGSGGEVVWEAVCGGEAGRMVVMWRVGMVRLTCELVFSNLRRLSITLFANGGVSCFGAGNFVTRELSVHST